MRLTAIPYEHCNAHAARDPPPTPRLRARTHVHSATSKTTGARTDPCVRVGLSCSTCHRAPHTRCCLHAGAWACLATPRRRPTPLHLKTKTKKTSATTMTMTTPGALPGTHQLVGSAGGHRNRHSGSHWHDQIIMANPPAKTNQSAQPPVATHSTTVTIPEVPGMPRQKATHTDTDAHTDTDTHGHTHRQTHTRALVRTPTAPPTSRCAANSSSRVAQKPKRVLQRHAFRRVRRQQPKRHGSVARRGGSAESFHALVVVVIITVVVLRRKGRRRRSRSCGGAAGSGRGC
jgi:hypothetical protein